MRPSTLGLALASGLLLANGPTWAQTQPSLWGAPAPTAPGPWPTSPPGAVPGSPGVGARPGSTGTVRTLDESEREDSGRGLEWFWLQAEGGVHYVGLDTISKGRLLLEGEKGSGAAPVAGLAAGGRVLFFTVGARARASFLPIGQLGTLHLEGGYHVPLGNFEPYVQLGAGYARLFGNDRPEASAKAPTVQGFDARLSGGFDYYVAPQFSLGLLASFELLWLWRSGVAASAEAAASEDPATQQAANSASRAGSGAGLATGLTAVAGLHF